ncbi:MAG TPA: zinc-binding dehydrogenase [Gammaproteobacteria bacterium]|nr:zinc-binding dehydrogenase [Gammaproteobacteria bacterium]
MSFEMRPDHRLFGRDITSLLESNELKHLIAARFDLKDIVAAHQLMESGAAIGNVVINVIQ